MKSEENMRHANFDIATQQGEEWLVNGKSVDDVVGEYLHNRMPVEISSWGSSECPYCTIPLRSKDFTDVIDGNETWHNNRLYASQHCERCAYWEFHGNEGGNKYMDPNDTIHVTSVAAKFSASLPEACSGELAQQ
jgi:hypothetical protein